MALALPAAAGADYPGQGPLDDPAVNAMVRSAEHFYDVRGVPALCPTLAVDRAPDLAGVDGRGWSCRIALADGFLTKYLGIVRDAEDNGLWGRRAAFRWTCRLVFHEVGHARGLEHRDTGIMNPIVPPGSRLRDAIPYDCWVLARQLVRRPACSSPVAVRRNARFSRLHSICFGLRRQTRR